MKKKNDTNNEPENQNNGESHTPRTYGQALRYFKYFFAWIPKLGFRTIFISLSIIGICYYIFWESGKDIILIEPFEVPEDLAKDGYTGKAIANKLLDQMNYIKNNSNSRFTPVFSSQSEEQDKKDKDREIMLIESTYPQVMLSSSQTEQIDIQIPGTGIPLNSIIRYVKKRRHHEPLCVIGEVTRQDKNELEVTGRVKGKQFKSVPGRIEKLDVQLRDAAEQIYKYTRPIILAGYLAQNEENNDSCIKVIRDIISQDAYHDQHYYAYAMWGYILQRQGKHDEAIEINPKILPPM